MHFCNFLLHFLLKIPKPPYYSADRHGMAKCPFHDDRHPSLKLKQDFYYCFGCGATGDVIDFVSRLYGLSAFEAAKKIASDFGLDPDKPPSASALVKPRHPMISAFREDERYCHRVLCDYLHLLEDWKVRYAPVTMEDEPDDRFVEACQMLDYIEYKCAKYGYTYDPEVGDPKHGIEPGTAFEDLPDDRKCPRCRKPKNQFVKEEEKKEPA